MQNNALLHSVKLTIAHNAKKKRNFKDIKLIEWPPVIPKQDSSKDLRDSIKTFISSVKGESRKGNKINGY